MHDAAQATARFFEAINQPRSSDTTFRGGTPPRLKTVKRLRLQAAAGLSPIRKEVVLPSGEVCHPTKGFRGPNIRGKQAPLPKRAREPLERSELSRVVAKLSNWQRRLYNSALGRLPSADEDERLVLARAALEAKRRG